MRRLFGAVKPVGDDAGQGDGKHTRDVDVDAVEKRLCRACRALPQLPFGFLCLSVNGFRLSGTDRTAGLIFEKLLTNNNFRFIISMQLLKNDNF